MESDILIPNVDFYIKVVVGILGVGFPILFQLTARLDDKYSSSQIGDLFDGEFIRKFFKGSLIVSLSCIILWSFNFSPPKSNWVYLKKLLYNSADWVVFLSTVVLLISFFLLVDKILRYYSPKSLISYLHKNHKVNRHDLKWFRALGDIFNQAIRRDNEDLAYSILRIFYEEYRLIRDSSKGKPTVYPEVYYSILHKAIQELATLDKRRDIPLEYRIAGNRLLLGELQNTEVSDKSYSWLWKNINLCLQYKNDDLIIHHWETAHQYYCLSPLIDWTY